MQRQHRQQIGIGHHPGGGEELVDCQHHKALTSQRCQCLVYKAEGPARKTDQHVTRCAKSVYGQRALGQRMVFAHHANVLTGKEPLVKKWLGLAALGARRQVSQHGRKVAHGQVASLFVEHAARVAGGQGNHAQRHAGSLFFKCFRQARDQFGGGRIRHGEHKAGVGLGRYKFVRYQRALQLRQRLAHSRPDGAGAWRGRHALAAALHQLVTQGFAQAPQRIAHGRLRQREVAGSPGQAALGHHLVKNAQ